MSLRGRKAEAIPPSGDGDCFANARSDMNQAIFKGVFTNLWHATDNENLECQSAL